VTVVSGMTRSHLKQRAYQRKVWNGGWEAVGSWYWKDLRRAWDRITAVPAERLESGFGAIE
jgi:hypothetical protein